MKCCRFDLSSSRTNAYAEKDVCIREDANIASLLTQCSRTYDSVVVMLESHSKKESENGTEQKSLSKKYQFSCFSNVKLPQNFILELNPKVMKTRI